MHIYYTLLKLHSFLLYTTFCCIMIFVREAHRIVILFRFQLLLLPSVTVFTTEFVYNIWTPRFSHIVVVSYYIIYYDYMLRFVYPRFAHACMGWKPTSIRIIIHIGQYCFSWIYAYLFTVSFSMLILRLISNLASSSFSVISLFFLNWKMHVRLQWTSPLCHSAYLHN